MLKSKEIFLKTVKNRNGEQFDLFWSKWVDDNNADYRMYFIKASHLVTYDLRGLWYGNSHVLLDGCQPVGREDSHGVQVDGAIEI